MDTFDLKKYLVENRAINQSKNIDEAYIDDQGKLEDFKEPNYDNFDDSKIEAKAQLLELEETVKSLNLMFSDILKYGLDLDDVDDLDDIKKTKDEWIKDIYDKISFLKSVI
jgi:hypothetical protein